MTKTELVAHIARGTGLTQRDVEDVFKVMETAVVNSLAADKKIVIPGVGILDVQRRAQRMARNPKTGEPAVVPARRAVKLRVSAGLKSTIS